MFSWLKLSRPQGEILEPPLFGDVSLAEGTLVVVDLKGFGCVLVSAWEVDDPG